MKNDPNIQIITIPQQYTPYTAELFNSEGKLLSNTKVVQKVRKNSDMMIDEVGLAHRLTSRIPVQLMAEICNTFASKQYVFEFIMN